MSVSEQTQLDWYVKAALNSLPSLQIPCMCQHISSFNEFVSNYIVLVLALWALCE